MTNTFIRRFRRWQRLRAIRDMGCNAIEHGGWVRVEYLGEVMGIYRIDNPQLLTGIAIAKYAMERQAR